MYSKLGCLILPVFMSYKNGFLLYVVFWNMTFWLNIYASKIRLCCFVSYFF